MRLCTGGTPQYDRPRNTPQLTCRWRQAICSRDVPGVAALPHGILVQVRAVAEVPMGSTLIIGML